MASKSLPSTKISLQNVSKRFGQKVVLNNISLDIPRGQSLVILGPSGVGKSVTLKCLLGLIQPDSGEIFIDGLNTDQHPETRHNIGMLFQGGALFDSLTIWENISFGLMQSKKVSPFEARQEALRHLHSVKLSSSIVDHYPSDLSGGMQKRVALARAIATRPEIIFFDEPTTGLDPIMAEAINHLIVSHVKKLGATAVTITHDINSAITIADRIALIYDGSIVWDGSVKEFQTTNNPYVVQMKTGSAEGPIQPKV